MYAASTCVILASLVPLPGLSSIYDTTLFPCEKKSSESDQNR